MSLNEKILLFLIDDDAVAAEVEKAIGGSVKRIIRAKNSDEAISKASNQVFDGFLLRLKNPIFENPKGAFLWSLDQEKYKKSPWIVLGKDIENDQVLIKNNHVKFVEDFKNTDMLIKMLGGVFFTTGTGAKGPAIDVSFINPIVTAVAEVIKTMAQIELKRETPFIKQPGATSGIKGDISGVIAMNSDRFVGSMAISFEEELILKIYKNMLGSELKQINDDVKDCVNEMTNIIFGNAKRDLNATGHTINAALPSVITGKGHEIRHAIQGLCLVIPFSAPEGKVVVECVINTEKPKK